MEITKCHLFGFSPCGGTMKVLDALAAKFPWPVEKHNLTRPIKKVACGPTDVAVFAFPVYSGRIPAISDGIFTALEGHGTPAVLVCVYGNRAYDEAFLNLDGEAKKHGFIPLAAVAGLAEHSIFPAVAAGRPDEKDIEVLGGFGEKIAGHLAGVDMDFRKTFKAPGREIIPKKLPIELFLPSTDFDKCTRCGKCVSACPTGAIPADAPNTTYVPSCLWCMACIKVCPEKARSLNHPAIPELAAGMAERCAARLEPEMWT